MKTILFWFRRDLRTSDNIGLSRAREDSDKLLTIFVADPTHSEWPHRNGDRLQFKLDAVDHLRGTVREAGGELLIRRNSPEEVIPRVAERESVNAVYWNRTYEPYELNRDDDVRTQLSQAGIKTETFKDQVLFEKEEILTNQSTPYKVFTYYADKWKSRTLPDSAEAVESFESPETVEAGELPDAQTMGLNRNLDEHEWNPTPEAANERWNDFLDNRIQSYENDREYPAREGSSKLSPQLRFGLISPRRIVKDCRTRLQHCSGDERSSLETFEEEIIWRDFYQQVLYNFPRVVDHNFKEKYNSVEWESHPEWFEAWTTGQTGFPIVDAAMRQLNKTGWMHNRLRMVVASFLTKDCMTHWKKGEKYFMNRLLDGDTASNNGGWQWAASTGNDAAPYFRIFNPYSQSKEYDPNGAFIRRYCPELEDLDDKKIHAPHRCDRTTLNEAGVELGRDYPEPILDHSSRRETALQKFKKAQEEG